MTRSRLETTWYWLALAIAASSCGETKDDVTWTPGDSSGSDLGVDFGNSGSEAQPVAPGSDFDACTGVSEEPENAYEPADIVFLVDNSPSMRDEIEWTRQNINEFSQTIAERGLDPRIVMISCLPGDCDGFSNSNGICVDPPLGSGNCPQDDTNLPVYLHVDVRMPSQKLLQRASDTYDQWAPLLRPEAKTHFVAISDDGELLSAVEFQSELAALVPPIHQFVFHGIYSSASKETACAISKDEPCCTYAAPSGEGVTYNELVSMTGGVGADLCAQDFEPVFVQFASSVVGHSELSCDWRIPPPPAGQSVDPNLVNLSLTTNGTTEYLGYVESDANCPASADAWFYDDPTQPNRVLVCPSTCERIRALANPKLELTFGCVTLRVEAT